MRWFILEVFVYTYIFSVIASGTAVFLALIYNTLFHGKREEVKYINNSANDEEYNLRLLLFRHPNSVIITQKTPVSECFLRQTNRIKFHQET